jgi:hypothetical protein|eukprot:COSAG01_NODE_2823_length_7006_cov_12.699146_7_plen_84_part_00
MVVIRAVAFCRQRGCHAGRPSHAISSQGAAESPPAGDRARRRAAARGAGPSQPATHEPVRRCEVAGSAPGLMPGPAFATMGPA